MSANIPNTMLLSDLLKPTGYNCPQDLQGKTFEASTSGGGDVALENNKTVSITENGTVEITPSEGKDAMKKVTATVNVSGGGGATHLYFWKVDNSSENNFYSDQAVAPTDTASLQSMKMLLAGTGIRNSLYTNTFGEHSIEAFGERISDNSFSTTVRGSTYLTYTRDSSKDVTLW